MKNIFSFFSLILILFIMSPKIHSISDCYFIVNTSLIDSVKSIVTKVKNELETLGNSIFIINNSNPNEGFILMPIYKGIGMNFVKEVYLTVDIKKYEKNILKVISKPEGNLSVLDINKEIKFLKPEKIQKFIPLLHLSYMKNDLGLKNYINFEKDGRVYYTVSSEDKLDDIHMIYESGNEKKEFKFTNSPEKPIVPVEEANKINQENIKPKKNFFSLPNFISKFFKKNYQEKNNNDFLDEEQKKLKVD